MTNDSQNQKQAPQPGASPTPQQQQVQGDKPAVQKPGENKPEQQK
jgi:hypothetical protein